MPPRSGFFNSSMGARSVNVEELFDIQQQAEFFVSLGQHDQAIELLRQHIYGATSTSGLAYLDLLQLYHRFNRRQEYDQLRDEFNHSFNAQVPQFEQFNQQSRGLEQYTSAIERIVALWKSPRILQVLQDSIFRKPEVGDAETFDLEAYRELLLLFAIAKEVADANPGVTGAAHDSNHAALGRSDGDIPSVFSTAGDTPLGAHTTPLATARNAPLSLSPDLSLDALSEPDFSLPKASPRLGLDVDLFELESVVAPLNEAQVPAVDLSLVDLDLPLAAPPRRTPQRGGPKPERLRVWCCPRRGAGQPHWVMLRSAANLQGAWVDDIGGCAFDVVHHVVESATEIQLVAVLLHIANVRCADTVLQA